MLEQLKVEQVDEKVRRYKSSWLHVTRMKKQQDAKSNGELWTKWMKMTWKTCEWTIR